MGVCKWGEHGSVVGVPEVEQWVFAHGVNMGHWWVFLRWTVIKVMGVSA